MHYHRARSGHPDASGARRGEDHPGAKLTADNVRQIRGLQTQGWSVNRIAAQFGVHSTTVRLVLTGRTWRQV
jgi:hypothetical protein